MILVYRRSLESNSRFWRCLTGKDLQLVLQVEHASRIIVTFQLRLVSTSAANIPFSVKRLGQFDYATGISFSKTWIRVGIGEQDEGCGVGDDIAWPPSNDSSPSPSLGQTPPYIASRVAFVAPLSCYHNR
jgi:hypothetical protein